MDGDGGSFYCWQVTQELTLWLVGAIKCQIDPSAKTCSNNLLSTIQTTPLFVPSEIEREATSGTVSSKIQPPSWPDYPPVVELPPSPNLGAIDISPTSSCYCTPTSSGYCTPTSSGYCTPTSSGYCTPTSSGYGTPTSSGYCTPASSGYCTPASSGYCTPASELIESPVLQLAPQQTRIHCILYQANDLQFDAVMALQPRLVSQDTPTGRSSPLFEYDTTTLAEAATSPPLPSMLLVCDNLPWEIRVLPSPPNLFVTIYDVLQTIHVNLRTPVATAEWPLCGTPRGREAILQIFERRIRRLSNKSAQNEERAKSVRRVDFLMGSTRLVRISSSEDPGVFVMEWGLPQ